LCYWSSMCRAREKRVEVDSQSVTLKLNLRFFARQEPGTTKRLPEL
jgi:hypothetical protein